MVIMKIGVVRGYRYHYSLFRDKVQKITWRNTFDLNFVLPRDIVVKPVLEIVIFVIHLIFSEVSPEEEQRR